VEILIDPPDSLKHNAASAFGEEGVRFYGFFPSTESGGEDSDVFQSGNTFDGGAAGADFYYAAPAKEMIAEPIFVLATPTFNDYLKDVV
jgi:hypothetical protein